METWDNVHKVAWCSGSTNYSPPEQENFSLLKMHEYLEWILINNKSHFLSDGRYLACLTPRVCPWGDIILCLVSKQEVEKRKKSNFNLAFSLLLPQSILCVQTFFPLKKSTSLILTYKMRSEFSLTSKHSIAAIWTWSHFALLLISDPESRKLVW